MLRVKCYSRVFAEYFLHRKWFVSVNISRKFNVFKHIFSHALASRPCMPHYAVLLARYEFYDIMK